MPRVSSHFSLQDPRFASLVVYTLAPATISTDANTTYTPAQVLGGFISHPSLTTGRTATLPSAAAMVEAMQGVRSDYANAFDFVISATGGTLTVAAGTGGTAVGVMTVATTNLKEFTMVFTNVGIGTEAYTVYSKGSSTP